MSSALMPAMLTQHSLGPTWCALTSQQGTHRACQLCTHGRQQGVLCACPEMQAEPIRTTAALRKLGGACGPDAKHLAFPGLI